MKLLSVQLAAAASFVTTSVSAAPFLFSTGDPDGQIATAARAARLDGVPEIESADDSVLDEPVRLTGATFKGLLTNDSTLAVAIYRVFPLDSVDPPSGNVPTRERTGR